MARDEFVEARAGEARDAQDLARADDEARIVQRAADGEILDREPRSGVARQLTPARGARPCLDLAADHGGHNLGQRHVVDQPVGHDLAVAHDGEVVTDLENLAQIVRNEHKADAL